MELLIKDILGAWIYQSSFKYQPTIMGPLRLEKSVPAKMTILSILVVISTMIPTATALNLPAWLSNLLPESGNGLLQDGIKCYSLPYGGFGFLSHVLTYWTIFCLNISRSPWRLAKLDKYTVDLILALISVTLTVLFSALAMVRCRNEWPVALIATWKMLLSLSLGCTAVHRALDVKRINKGPHEVKRSRWLGKDRIVGQAPKYSKLPSFWLLLYGIGIVIGLVGLIAAVIQVWPTRTKAMEIISAVFGITVLLTGIFGVAIGLCIAGTGHFVLGGIGGIGIAVFGVIGMIGILAALYSDWMLAAIEVQSGGSWAGYPTSDTAWLYWTYFAAKRLPFFST
jgi:hypothetical protein